MSTFLRNKAIFKTTSLRKENPFPQFNVASHLNAQGSGFLLNTQQHCFQGEGGEGRTGTATMFWKILSKYTIFSTVLSKIVYKVIRVFSQEYWQGQNKNMLIKSTLQKLFWAQSFTPDHLLMEKHDLIYVFCRTLFKTVRFCNSRTTRANCYIFSCSSGMEGSENVKSNLSFSRRVWTRLVWRFSSKKRSSWCLFQGHNSQSDMETVSRHVEIASQSL